MQMGQTNMGRNMMNNSMGAGIPSMPDRVTRNLNSMAPKMSSSNMSTNMMNSQGNVAGIAKTPVVEDKFKKAASEDRFKNVRMDKDPAKQIMNSAGQNVIQNKIRGVGDLSSR